MAADGSIFVCFLCEKEFRQVTALEEHMKCHGSLPDMSTDLPSRRRGGRGTTTFLSKKPIARVVSSKTSTIKTNVLVENLSKIAGRHSDYSDEFENEGEEIMEDHAENVVAKSAPDSVIRKEKAEHSQKVKVKPLALPIVKIKKELSPQESLTARAMRIRQYIMRQEESSRKKDENKEEDGSEDSSSLLDEGAHESVMMVDSSFFTSGTSSTTPIGPTIMSAEPDGLICPLPQSAIDMHSRGKKNSSMRKRLSSSLDSSYFMGEDDEVMEQELLEDGSEDQAMEIATFYPQKTRGRGRGRGKRGRPPMRTKPELHSIEAGVDDSDSEYKEMRPGRRSQPRVIEENLQYECLQCNKRFRSLTTVKVHARSHTESKEIHCPYCDEIFPQRYILYEHLANDHEEGSSLVCPVCKKMFTRPDSLKSHMVRMHEENGGLNCFACGKNFPSQGQLEMHVRVHTGERPFKCDLCNKGFVQKVHLRTHLRTMHNVTDMPCTPCRICGSKFDSRMTLRDHVAAKHRLTITEYRMEVNKLRREGKIPDFVPPKVKIVEPSFRYRNVRSSDLEEAESSEVGQNGIPSVRGKRGVILTRKRGRKLKVRGSLKNDKRVPGMGTVMNLLSDDEMFSPYPFEESDEPPKGRDQEELSLVETAFKVAEEMDQLGETSSAVIVSGDDSSSSNLYYSVPVMLNSTSSLPLQAEHSSRQKSRAETLSSSDNHFASITMDDEYAEFAAEHSHMDGTDEYDGEQQGVELSSQNYIIKREPLELYSGSTETSAVEMLNM